jgi:hypothetical protein
MTRSPARRAQVNFEYYEWLRPPTPPDALKSFYIWMTPIAADPWEVSHKRLAPRLGLPFRRGDQGHRCHDISDVRPVYGLMDVEDLLAAANDPLTEIG